ncbi:MAG: PA14 domain-containing protein [Planctomycetota bacterium]|nr:PA14 domain-containing protein [Planctomycetota bacterium]
MPGAVSPAESDRAARPARRSTSAQPIASDTTRRASERAAPQAARPSARAGAEPPRASQRAEAPAPEPQQATPRAPRKPLPWKKLALPASALLMIAAGYAGGSFLRGASFANPAEPEVAAASTEAEGHEGPALAVANPAPAEPGLPPVLPGLRAEWWDWSKVKGKFESLPKKPERAPDAIYQLERGGFHVEKGKPPGAPSEKVYGRLSGKMKIEQEGLYTFWVTSDDGSRLFINGALVADNDGSHKAESMWGQVDLKPGEIELLVEYFNAGSPAECWISYKPADGVRERVSGEQLRHETLPGEKVPEPKKEDEKEKTE